MQFCSSIVFIEHLSVAPKRVLPGGTDKLDAEVESFQECILLVSVETG